MSVLDTEAQEHRELIGTVGDSTVWLGWFSDDYMGALLLQHHDGSDEFTARIRASRHKARNAARQLWGDRFVAEPWPEDEP